MRRPVQVQEQRGADDRDRREGHSEAREHGRQLDAQDRVEHASSEGHHREIIPKRPHEVDPDAAHHRA
eukprot:6765217-Prymnesium_polylepis.1